METKTIKLSKENYKWLCEIAGRIQTEEKRSVSIDEALSRLKAGGKLSELAGVWKISDKEAKAILRGIKKGWANWKGSYA